MADHGDVVAAHGAGDRYGRALGSHEMKEVHRARPHVVDNGSAGVDAPFDIHRGAAVHERCAAGKHQRGSAAGIAEAVLVGHEGDVPGGIQQNLKIDGGSHPRARAEEQSGCVLAAVAADHACSYGRGSQLRDGLVEAETAFTCHWFEKGRYVPTARWQSAGRRRGRHLASGRRSPPSRPVAGTAPLALPPQDPWRPHEVRHPVEAGRHGLRVGRHEADLADPDLDSPPFGLQVSRAGIHAVIGPRIGPGSTRPTLRRNVERLVIGAADADRRRRRAHLVVALVRPPDQARQGAKAALEEAENSLLAAVLLSGKLVGVETQSGIGAQGDQGLVGHQQLRMAVRAGHHGIAFLDPGALGGDHLPPVWTDNLDVTRNELESAGIRKDRQRRRQQRNGSEAVQEIQDHVG
ncbi:MAG: hypothetical protein GAKPKEKM_01138 [Rhodocyclaceae bacterium]|nr:hypothetical protein [Rhodocyclaceae bacterium]